MASRTSPKRDYYEVLGVSRTAGSDEIKRAYRMRAKELHPDVSTAPDSEALFKELNEAYQVLGDQEKREVYDQYGHQAFESGGAGPGPGPTGGLDDLFSMFFGDGFGRSSPRSGPERGDDLQVELEITLEDAAHGVTADLRYSHMEACDICGGSGARDGTAPEKCTACNGSGQIDHVQRTPLGAFRTSAPCGRCRATGKVIHSPCAQCNGQGRLTKRRERKLTVPAGVDTGSTMSISGQGDAGMRGGPAGDLYVVLRVRQHKVFERRGTTLFCEVPISFVTAALGGDVTVPTIDGDETLTIPEGTQTGSRFTVRGKGIPELNSSRRGDSVVVVRVDVPKKLTGAQREALEAFASAMGQPSAKAHDKGLFGRIFGGES